MGRVKQLIPKYFELGGVPYNVIPATYYKIEDSTEGLGQERSADGLVLLATHFKGRPMPHEKIVNTFYHELSHALFDTMGHPLVNDEVMCQTLGNLLMEYDRTKDNLISNFLDARQDNHPFIKSIRKAYNCEGYGVDPFYEHSRFEAIKSKGFDVIDSED